MLLLALIVPSIAQAQEAAGGELPELQSQLFQPTLDGSRSLWLPDSAVGPSGEFLARGLLSWTNQPLVYVYADESEAVLVDDVFQLDLAGGYVYGPARFAVGVPVYLRSTGEAGGETGLGDLRADVKVRLLDREAAPVGVAAWTRLGLPTSTVEASLGAGGVSWDLGAVADRELGPVLVAANLGFRIQPREELENVVIGDQLLYGLHGGYAITDDAGAALELVGHASFASFGDAAAAPLELIPEGWWRPGGGNLVLRGGLGFPLSRGVGAPQTRVVLAAGWEPREERDRDGDGIVDKSDACRDTPEDVDTWKDDDGCPEPTDVTVRFTGANNLGVSPQANVASQALNGGGTLALNPGDYPVNASLDAYKPLSSTLSVPPGPPIERTFVMELLPGVLVLKVVDEAGQPVVAKVGLGDPGAPTTVNGETRLERAAGDLQLEVRVPGFVTRKVGARLEPGKETVLEVRMERELAVMTAERIEIKDSVYFETGKAVIKPESFPLLNQVATILLEHPEITKLRIEGHTDSRGSASSNLNLSKSRAAAVREYLVSKGVSADRLDSQGYGESKPLEKANNEAAWAKNRRVDFFIVGRAEPKP